MTPDGAYTGLKVLDLGQGIAAPYCAMLLAMHGAEVVKLEPPGGDWSRGLGKRYGDHTAMSAHFNRGKQGLALDLRAPAGRDIALKLLIPAALIQFGNPVGESAKVIRGQMHNGRLDLFDGTHLGTSSPHCSGNMHEPPVVTNDEAGVAERIALCHLWLHVKFRPSRR